GSHPGQAERPTRVPALRRLTDLRYQRLAERTRGRSPQGRGANTQGHRPELVLVVERDQALAHRIRRRLAAPREAELVEDVAHVVASGLLGDHQLFGNLAVGVAAGDE